MKPEQDTDEETFGGVRVIGRADTVGREFDSQMIMKESRHALR